MITRLDHVSIESDVFAECCKRYERLLGRTPTLTGEPADAALLALENGALRISPNREHGTRLAALVFASDDRARVSDALSAIDATARPAQTREGAYAEHACRWDAFGVPIAVIEAQPRAALEAAAPASLSALDHVVVRTPDAARAKRVYGEALALRLALEREFQGVRMLFYRIAGVTIEVVEDARSERDVLHGLAYRTRDIHAAHTRLHAEGLTLSEVRAGRKPGTHVFTVREGACGVPTLILSDPARS